MEVLSSSSWPGLWLVGSFFLLGTNSVTLLSLQGPIKISFLHVFGSVSEGGGGRLGNLSESSGPSTQPSVSDFQDFVSEMQQTITSLRKQVAQAEFPHRIDLLQDNVVNCSTFFVFKQIKRLERRLSQTECTDSAGRERTDGDRWEKDPCTLCECKVGRLDKLMCPAYVGNITLIHDIYIHLFSFLSSFSTFFDFHRKTSIFAAGCDLIMLP